MPVLQNEIVFESILATSHKKKQKTNFFTVYRVWTMIWGFSQPQGRIKKYPLPYRQSTEP